MCCNATALRQQIHPAAHRCNFELPAHYDTYLDLSKDSTLLRLQRRPQTQSYSVGVDGHINYCEMPTSTECLCSCCCYCSSCLSSLQPLATADAHCHNDGQHQQQQLQRHQEIGLQQRRHQFTCYYTNEFTIQGELLTADNRPQVASEIQCEC